MYNYFILYNRNNLHPRQPQTQQPQSLVQACAVVKKLQHWKCMVGLASYYYTALSMHCGITIYGHGHAYIGTRGAREAGAPYLLVLLHRILIFSIYIEITSC